MTYSRQEQEMFRSLISGFDKEEQARLTLMYAHNSIIAREEKRREMERMKQEIVEEVLSRISIMFETGKAIKEIDVLNKSIEQLER